MNISSVQVTITYPVVGFDTSNNNKRRGNIGEEMLLPRTLEIKFGEEYSSSEHYIAIHVLLFHDDAKKNLQNDK